MDTSASSGMPLIYYNIMYFARVEHLEYLTYPTQINVSLRNVFVAIK